MGFRVRKSERFDYGQIIIKKYGSVYKLVQMPFVQSGGYELTDEEKAIKNKYSHGEILTELSTEDFTADEYRNGYVTLLQGNPFTDKDERFESSIVRSKNTIQELALCNEWEYFVTLTLDASKVDRYDADLFRKVIPEWLHGYNRRHTSKVQYLLVPEKHKNGAWHAHGFLKGIPQNDLVINENGYLDWLTFKKKFGYVSLSKVKDSVRSASYIRKYISKDLAKSVQEAGANLYYCSHGLKRAEVLYKGNGIVKDDYSFGYEHPQGYCSVSQSEDLHSLLSSVVLYDSTDFLTSYL